MKRVLSLFLFLVALAGISVLNANQDTKNEGTPVPFTQLDPKRPGLFASNSGISKPLRVVIRDREAWLKLWKQIASQQQPSPPPPDIDFSREMLIVVAMGQRNTGGFGIIVDGVYKRDKKLEVVVKSTSPGNNCMTTQALTQPVDIVRVQKSDYSVVFREIDVRNDCG